MTERAKLYSGRRYITFWIGVLPLAQLWVAGCGGSSPAHSEDSSRVQPSYGADGKLQALAYDRDNDGKADAWGYMDGARVSRVEVDEDGDGRVDRWEYYEPAAERDGQTPDQRALVRIERAMKHDGTVSRREFFASGRLARVEEDADGDGRLDKWETYTDGALSVLSLDTSGRGRPDRRLVYGPDGALVRMEEDSDGSGNFKAMPQ